MNTYQVNGIYEAFVTTVRAKSPAEAKRIVFERDGKNPNSVKVKKIGGTPANRYK